MNDLKIKGALIDVIRYMEEDGCVELGENINYNKKKYYIIIELEGGKNE